MTPVRITNSKARALWLNAQALDVERPFGTGAVAVKKAMEHLGYVQIDTINVIERCHHHILYSRIPEYRRSDLHRAQTIDKSVFEYWTHALAYIPTRDYKYSMLRMKNYRQHPSKYFQQVTAAETRKVMNSLRKNGALTIRDFNDEVLVDKDHEWASRKPSKKVLQKGFYDGSITISERIGMLKKYELASRHFAFDPKPKAATAKEVLEYELDRALRAQAFVSLESVCHLVPSKKPDLRKLIEARIRKKELVPVHIDGITKPEFWISPIALESDVETSSELVHILSPFDPLIIQRKRLSAIFGYEHRFEAYIPKDKRKFGYFALPVLIGDEIVAVLDLKTDRALGKLLIQQWTWMPGFKSAARKKQIEEELKRFEKFQLAKN